MNRYFTYPLLVLLALIAAFGASIPTASAHAGTSIAYSDIQVGQDQIDYSLRIDLYDLRIAVAPNDSDVGETTPEVLERFIQNNRTGAASYLLSKIILYADSFPLEGELTDLKLTTLSDQPYVDVKIEYPLKHKPERLILDYHPVFDDVDQWHVNYVTLTMNDHKQSAVLNFNDRELDLGKTSLWRTVREFFVLGIEHLLTGYDHMLFLLALLLGARSVKQILTVVTAFTCAHTITLLLSGLHVFGLPSRFVEPVIALSIIYVAMTNLLRKDQAAKYNVLPAFGFGLIHGFGFAGTLSEMRLDHEQLVASLLTFNVGIEAAQVGLVLLLYPIVRYARRWKLSTPALASTISLCGFFWLIQRLFF